MSGVTMGPAWSVEACVGVDGGERYVVLEVVTADGGFTVYLETEQAERFLGQLGWAIRTAEEVD